MTQPSDFSSTANVDWTSDPTAINYTGYQPAYEDKIFYVTRGNNFTGTVIFTDTNSTNPEYTTVVKVVTAERVTPQERDSINILKDRDQFTVSGVYWSGWNDQYNYVPFGESSNTSETLTATDNGNCPSNQVLFNLDQDVTDYVNKFYDVSLDVVPTTYDQATTSVDGDIRLIGDLYNTSVQVKQRVVNNYNEITEFIGDYYASSN